MKRPNAQAKRAALCTPLLDLTHLTIVPMHISHISYTYPSSLSGVTYCGESMASTLTMANVPWHEEVVSFTSQLCNLLDNKYELAAEHEHSNCILVANKRFKVRLMEWNVPTCDLRPLS